MATLGNPKNTIEVIQKYEFAFQKKFGQNFLLDKNILNNIVNLGNITNKTLVIEVGVGAAALTKKLCEKAGVSFEDLQKEINT